ncbi:MAG: hypothetical protein ACR2G3_06800 [Solirubrobacterales bacterium]
MRMAFNLTPGPGDPGEPQVQIGRVGGAEADSERRLVRDGAQVLGHGALICPECELPLALAGRLRAAGPVRCPYCGHESEARAFVREDVYDTLANEVYLIARVG